MIIGGVSVIAICLGLSSTFCTFFVSAKYSEDNFKSTSVSNVKMRFPSKSITGAFKKRSVLDEDIKSKAVKTSKSKKGTSKISFEVLGPSKDYDSDFMNEWWKMMRELWTAGGGANGIHSSMPTSSVDFVPLDKETPYRVKKLYSQWTSPDCKFVNLNLKHPKILQDGDSNKVILMKDVNTKKRYVIKSISNPDAFFSELSFFLFIDPNHPYFSRAVCHRRTKADNGNSKAKIIFEYVAGVESLEYARTAKFEDLIRISAQLFLAIEHMHYLKFIHADLKPHNVLIDTDGNVKVIDFGFTSQLPYGKKSQGTHFTMAPELHNKVPGLVHEGVDWWAFGSTIAMWFGAYYDELSFMKSHKGQNSNRTGHKNTCILMNWTDKGKFESGSVPKEFPESLRSFLYIFFSVDPDARLFNTPRLLKQIRNHEFFSNINWSQLHGGEFGKIYPVDN